MQLEDFHWDWDCHSFYTKTYSYSQGSVSFAISGCIITTIHFIDNWKHRRLTKGDNNINILLFYLFVVSTACTNYSRVNNTTAFVFDLDDHHQLETTNQGISSKRAENHLPLLLIQSVTATINFRARAFLTTIFHIINNNTMHLPQ